METLQYRLPPFPANFFSNPLTQKKYQNNPALLYQPQEPEDNEAYKSLENALYRDHTLFEKIIPIQPYFAAYLYKMYAGSISPGTPQAIINTAKQYLHPAANTHPLLYREAFKAILYLQPLTTELIEQIRNNNPYIPPTKIPDYTHDLIRASKEYHQNNRIGVRAKSLIYNLVMQITPSFDIAQAFYEELKNPYATDIAIDEISYSTLIDKSQDFLQAKLFLDEMKKAGYPPNEISYSTLINKSKDFEQAKYFFDEMKKMGYPPNEISYSTLINKSRDFEQAKYVFDEMKKKGLTPNEISYNTLINKSTDFVQAKLFFDEMKKMGLTPNEISYSTLLNKSKDFEQAKYFFDEMKKMGLMPNEISYNTLINKSRDFEQTKYVFDEMKKMGLTPDEISYSTLINKSKDFEQAKYFFDEMKSKGLKIDEIAYLTLINKSRDFEQAKYVFDEMKKKGLTPDEISYSTLINKSTDFVQAKQFFDEMKEKGLTPNEISYSTLINKSTDFETIKPYYEQFLQKFKYRAGNFKIEKNYNYLYSAMFKAVKTKEQFEYLHNDINRLNVNLDESYHRQVKQQYEDLLRRHGK